MFTQSARYYDAILSARGKDYEEETRRLHDFIAAHKRSSGEALLDVGCGTGSHLVYLKARYEVQGLDLDAAMLDIAAEKLPGVKLRQGDMVDFDLEQQFDVIVCLFSSIGYVGTGTKLEQAIQNMANHAKPGGLVIVEPWLYPEDFEAGKPHALLVDSPEMKLARISVNEVRDGVSILNFHYLLASEDGVQHFQEKHELALFTHDEYVLAFQLANLEVVYDKEGLEGRGLFIGRKPLQSEK